MNEDIGASSEREALKLAMLGVDCPDCGHGYRAHDHEGICWAEGCDCDTTRDEVLYVVAATQRPDDLEATLRARMEALARDWESYSPSSWDEPAIELREALEVANGDHP